MCVPRDLHGRSASEEAEPLGPGSHPHGHAGQPDLHRLLRLHPVPRLRHRPRSRSDYPIRQRVREQLCIKGWIQDEELWDEESGNNWILFLKVRLTYTKLLILDFLPILFPLKCTVLSYYFRTLKKPAAVFFISCNLLLYLLDKKSQNIFKNNWGKVIKPITYFVPRGLNAK